MPFSVGWAQSPPQNDWPEHGQSPDPDIKVLPKKKAQAEISDVSFSGRTAQHTETAHTNTKKRPLGTWRLAGGVLSWPQYGSTTTEEMIQALP